MQEHCESLRFGWVLFVFLWTKLLLLLFSKRNMNYQDRHPFEMVVSNLLVDTHAMIAHWLLFFVHFAVCESFRCDANKKKKRTQNYWFCCWNSAVLRIPHWDKTFSIRLSINWRQIEARTSWKTIWTKNTKIRIE